MADQPRSNGYYWIRERETGRQLVAHFDDGDWTFTGALWVFQDDEPIGDDDDGETLLERYQVMARVDEPADDLKRDGGNNMNHRQIPTEPFRVVVQPSDKVALREIVSREMGEEYAVDDHPAMEVGLAAYRLGYANAVNDSLENDGNIIYRGQEWVPLIAYREAMAGWKDANARQMAQQIAQRAGKRVQSDVRHKIAWIISPTAFELSDELARPESQGFPEYEGAKAKADEQVANALTKADAILALDEYEPDEIRAQAESYRDMHDIATRELGYPSILEALEAAPPMIGYSDLTVESSS